MFTGIIEEIGEIKYIKKNKSSVTIFIKASKILSDLNIGDSVSTNGVCLTVTKLENDGFSADVMPETIRLSNLSELKNKSIVNLERALTLESRLGGHMVSGHVDCVGTIKSIRKDEIAYIYSIKIPTSISKFIIHKGSIAIDGISLTVTMIDNTMVEVSIIPHTLSSTILGSKNKGDTVNIEVDMIGKYVSKIINLEPSSHNISRNFLIENGF